MSALLAIPAQGTTLVLGATATAVTGFTAISKANPAVATKTSHGMTTGTVVKVSGATGMTEINNRIAIVQVLDVNTVALGGIDSTLFATAATAGTLTPTACKVNGMESYQNSGAAASQIPATDLDSTQQEIMSGLSGAGTFSISVQKSFTDDGQRACEASAQTSGVPILMTLTAKGQTAVTTTGSCSKTDFSGGVDALTKGSADFILAAKWK